jgi:pimeloyl-ACP methyl ester carboxylesterase
MSAPLPRSRVLRVAAALAAVLVLAAAGGAAAEELARRRGTPEPPPGRLVPVAGTEMHLHCTGTPTGDAPTVVLEAGLGEPGLTWAEVQASLATRHRVCSYDRAGYGWSEPRQRPWTATAVARELSALLDAAGEQRPYVLVAHSVGSFVSRALTALDPDAVAGLVLLDPTRDDAVEDAGRPVGALVERRVLRALVRVGVLRAAGRRLVPALVNATPPEQLLRRLTDVYDDDAVAASIAELEGTVPAVRELRQLEPTSWRDLPVRVVSAAGASDADRTFHARLAARSSRGVHVVLGAGGHYVHYDAPSSVVDIVERLVADVRPDRRGGTPSR